MLEVKGGPPSVLECCMFGTGAVRWTSTWMWWHDLVLVVQDEPTS